MISQGSVLRPVMKMDGGDDTDSPDKPFDLKSEKEQMEMFHQLVLRSIEENSHEFLSKAKEMRFPVFDSGTDYVALYEKIHAENSSVMDQMHKLIYELTYFQILIMVTNEKIEENERRIAQIQSENFENTSFKKPKYRRKNNELNKQHKCQYKNCDKTYGSDVSLNLHIKLKHNGGNKTQRQIQGKRVLQNKRIDFPLNFYPGYLDQLQSQLQNNHLDAVSQSQSKKQNCNL